MNGNNNGDMNGNINGDGRNISLEERFSQVVAAVLMNVEELRQQLTSSSSKQTKPKTQDVVHWRDELEELLHQLETLTRLYLDKKETTTATGEEETTDSLLRTNCHHKVMSITHETLQLSYNLQEPDEESSAAANVPLDVMRQDGQAAIARMAEIMLLVIHQTSAACTNNKVVGNFTTSSTTEFKSKDVVQSYVDYQRQVLRQRAKPSIARLVQTRQQQQQQHSFQHKTLRLDDEDDASSNNRQPHAATIALILGQAALLIHPLLSWQLNLPPASAPSNEFLDSLRSLCEDACVIIDEQAQSLVQTIASWLSEDWDVSMWMHKSNDPDHVSKHLSRDELGVLDGLVEEMAYSCHVSSRYLSLVCDVGSGSSSSNNNSKKQSTLHDMLQEWTWKYAALERFLAVQNWQSALELAQPTAIVLGTSIQVPSVVEDAQYLSMRALTRASTTKSAMAVGTVAHAVSHDVWSTTELPGSVHDALLSKRGCWSDHEATAPNDSTSLQHPSDGAPKSGDFASALLDALDEDLPPPKMSPLVPKQQQQQQQQQQRRPPSAPSSGSFLAFVGRSIEDEELLFQRQLDTDFCALNGTHAACVACRALVSFLDSLLSFDDDDDDEALEKDDKAMAMIQLAREELFRYAQAYEHMMESQIHTTLEAYSRCFFLLQQFFEHEDYNLNTSNIAAAESDERIEREMMEPLKASRFLGQLANKLESEVRQKMGDAIVATLVQAILDVLWTSPSDNTDSSNRRFTDLGALLLSKQVRILQGFVASILSEKSDTAVPNLSIWERLSQVLTALQLEKPSDWLAYYHKSSSLSPEELLSTLLLRVDFSPDAVQAVVTQVSKASSANAASIKS